MPPTQKPRVFVDAPADKLRRLRELQQIAAEREKNLVVEDRKALLEQCPHPLALAMYFDDKVVSTPAIELISKQWVKTLHTTDGRCVTSLGPQQGKSQLSRWTVLWALLDNPDRRVVYASYSMGLARTSGRIIRSLVAQYGAPYGLELDQAHHDAADWQLDGFLGGVLSASTESTLTGRPADCIAAGTPISTPSGLVKADDIEPGNTVLTLNHNTSAQEPKRVVATRRIDSRPVVDVLTSAGDALRCTADHRVHTATGYQAAGTLRLGAELTNVEGDPTSVVAVFPAGHETVYDLEVEGNANFYAAGVLVHNCMILDDLLAGEAEANSPTIREKVDVWWESTARVRMAPGSPAIAIGTRWTENDALSRWINEGWDRINIPAKADSETLDSLAGVPGGRTEDGYLISTRGTTPEDFELTRREVGARAWAALYLGRPAPLEGGIYQRAWFSQFREWEKPRDLDLVGVFIDPAETGKGDAAGILVAGRTRAGRVPFLADYTGQYSASEWGRRACLAWLEWNAARIVQERTLGLRTTVPDAWAILYRQATALQNVGVVKNEYERAALALTGLLEAGDTAAASKEQLQELLPLWQKVLDAGPSGPRIVTITPKMSKRIRAESAAPAWETGRAYCVGFLKDLEHEASTWVEGAPSPNRLDTMAMATAYLEQAGAKASVARRPRHLQAVPTSTVHTLAR